MNSTPQPSKTLLLDEKVVKREGEKLFGDWLVREEKEWVRAFCPVRQKREKTRTHIPFLITVTTMTTMLKFIREIIFSILIEKEGE